MKSDFSVQTSCVRERYTHFKKKTTFNFTILIDYETKKVLIYNELSQKTREREHSNPSSIYMAREHTYNLEIRIERR